MARLSQFGAMVALLFLLGGHVHGAESIARELSGEVVVYGATPGGVCAAVAAAREGRSVIVVEPSRWVGGLLGAGFRISEDTPVKATLGGLALRLHTEDSTWGAGNHDSRSLNNQKFFKALLEAHPTIRLVTEHRLRKVVRAGGRITALLLENAPPDAWGVPAPAALSDDLMAVKGLVFIDASYEGDVMAGAGVPYAVGRESKAEYGESLAGVRGFRKFPGVSPYVKEGDPASGLLPMVKSEPVGEPGSASPFCMGYNFKLAWLSRPTKEDPGFALPPPDPKDPAAYEFLRRIRQAGYRITWPHYNSSRDEICTGALPGLQRDYAAGDWPARSRIWKAYIDHIRTLTDFTSKNARLKSNGTGDVSSWPHQLYVRTARRMRGAYVMTQADVAGQTTVADSIGLGFYPVDFYPARLGVLEDGTLVQEGGGIFLISPGPFPLPYRAITPKKQECENLLVPVCLSASHVAYASIRMEAQYMILGESTGVAAAQSLAEGKAVQDINVAELQDRLRKCGQKIAWEDKSNYRQYYRSFPAHVPVWWHAHPEEYAHNPPIENDPSDVLVDDADASKAGRWQTSLRDQPFVMEGYLHDAGEGKGTKSITFAATLRTGGEYEVFVSYIAAPRRSHRVPVCIRHAAGETRVLLDQTRRPTLDQGRFLSLGRFRFEKGKAATVTLSTEGTDDGDVVADSVLFVPVAPKAPAPKAESPN